MQAGNQQTVSQADRAVSQAVIQGYYRLLLLFPPGIEASLHSSVITVYTRIQKDTFKVTGGIWDIWNLLLHYSECSYYIIMLIVKD